MVIGVTPFVTSSKTTDAASGLVTTESSGLPAILFSSHNTSTAEESSDSDNTALTNVRRFAPTEILACQGGISLVVDSATRCIVYSPAVTFSRSGVRPRSLLSKNTLTVGLASTRSSPSFGERVATSLITPPITRRMIMRMRKNPNFRFIGLRGLDHTTPFSLEAMQRGGISPGLHLCTAL